jgi:hypothetical protein
MASWTDESVLQRPPSEDRGCHREKHAQGPGGPYLRGRDLVRQALRHQSPKRRASGATHSRSARKRTEPATRSSISSSATWRAPSRTTKGRSSTAATSRPTDTCSRARYWDATAPRRAASPNTTPFVVTGRYCSNSSTHRKTTNPTRTGAKTPRR